MTSDTEHPHDTIELISIDTTYTLSEICHVCGLDAADLSVYIEHGIIVADTVDARLYNHRQLERLQRALRLQADLEVNHAGAALALDLLDTIAELKRDLAVLKR